ncbi:MAG: S-layer protein domain-containing protein [Candidatus Methanoperedens sp.]|nr:S-layer protein domain-containing protein [Candidatus Methanoperedens sp.]
MNRGNKKSRIFQPLLLFISIIALTILSGCVSQQPEMLKVNPVIDYAPLEGYAGKSEGIFTVIRGSIPEVKESLKDIIIKKAAQTSTFSVNDDLNLVVFRGVFNTGGYGINIDRVEKQGNIFTVYTTYIDPGEGVGVTEAFTQPAAIVPIGKLAAGDYKARLRVTRVLNTFEGKKVIETERELGIFNFEVKPAKPPEEIIYYYTGASRFDKEQALTALNEINGSDEAKFVTSGKSYSVVVFMHPYRVGVFDPTTAEWVVVMSSIPEKTEETKIAIFRLDYQTFELKKSYKFSYPVKKEFSLEESIGIMEEEIKKDPYGNPYGNRPVEREKITFHGGNYLYSYPATDFGGTIIINRYAGRAIFFATTVWDGRGKLIIPEEGEPGGTPLKPSPSGYILGQAFDEISGILTKKWDAENFAGFWRDPEANVSSETLVINQSTLNNTYRVIEKYNLIYTTKSIPLKYQVYVHVNKTPPGTDGLYSAIGWQGEKYVLLQGDRLTRIIFEQNTTDIKTMQIEESWGFGEGYRLFAHSIEIPLPREEQAWMTFFKGNDNLDDKVLPNNYLYSYIWGANASPPVFLTYISNIHKLPHTNAADFRYTWLRSQNITEIKEGDTFGIMEVTSIDNGKIELRNREPVYLAPEKRIHLMGNISIQVGNSEDSLQFHPFRVRKP